MLHILIIEDESALRKAYGDALEMLSDAMRVTFAANGAEGLRCLRSTRYDLLILDLKLPDMAGEDIMTLIRGDASHQNFKTPILVATGNSERASKTAALIQRGAQHVLRKPFGGTVLLHTVQRLLHPPQAA